MGADNVLAVDQFRQQFIRRWFIMFRYWKGADGAIQAPEEESK